MCERWVSALTAPLQATNCHQMLTVRGIDLKRHRGNKGASSSWITRTSAAGKSLLQELRGVTVRIRKETSGRVAMIRRDNETATRGQPFDELPKVIARQLFCGIDRQFV